MCIPHTGSRAAAAILVFLPATTGTHLVPANLLDMYGIHRILRIYLAENPNPMIQGLLVLAPTVATISRRRIRDPIRYEREDGGDTDDRP